MDGKNCESQRGKGRKLRSRPNFRGGTSPKSPNIVRQFFSFSFSPGPRSSSLVRVACICVVSLGKRDGFQQLADTARLVPKGRHYSLTPCLTLQLVLLLSHRHESSPCSKLKFWTVYFMNGIFMSGKYRYYLTR